MPRDNVVLASRHQEALYWLAHKTQLSKSDIVRRMIDYCSQSTVLDLLIPCLSGTFVPRSNRSTGLPPQASGVFLDQPNGGTAQCPAAGS